MGFFSWNCAKCGQPILNPHLVTKETSFLNEVAWFSPGGNIILGSYDGYGRLLVAPDELEVVIACTGEAEPCLVHQCCMYRRDLPLIANVSTHEDGQGYFHSPLEVMDIARRVKDFMTQPLPWEPGGNKELDLPALWLRDKDVLDVFIANFRRLDLPRPPVGSEAMVPDEPKIRLRMTLDVTFVPKGRTVAELKEYLHGIASDCTGDQLSTSGLDSGVDTWSVVIEEFAAKGA